MLSCTHYSVFCQKKSPIYSSYLFAPQIAPFALLFSFSSRGICSLRYLHGRFPSLSLFSLFFQRFITKTKLVENNAPFIIIITQRVQLVEQIFSCCIYLFNFRVILRFPLFLSGSSILKRNHGKRANTS